MENLTVSEYNDKVLAAQAEQKTWINYIYRNEFLSVFPTGEVWWWQSNWKLPSLEIAIKKVDEEQDKLAQQTIERYQSYIDDPEAKKDFWENFMGRSAPSVVYCQQVIETNKNILSRKITETPRQVEEFPWDKE